MIYNTAYNHGPVDNNCSSLVSLNLPSYTRYAIQLVLMYHLQHAATQQCDTSFIPKCESLDLMSILTPVKNRENRLRGFDKRSKNTEILFPQDHRFMHKQKYIRLVGDD